MTRKFHGRARMAAAAMAAIAMGGALTAAATPEGPQNDKPVLVAETVNADGSTTSKYSDGSSFTFEAPSTGLGEIGLDAVIASSVQSRDWTATYSVSITSQYFHHDGG